jgi:hypothetical protein
MCRVFGTKLPPDRATRLSVAAAHRFAGLAGAGIRQGWHLARMHGPADPREVRPSDLRLPDCGSMHVAETLRTYAVVPTEGGIRTWV